MDENEFTFETSMAQPHFRVICLKLAAADTKKPSLVGDGHHGTAEEIITRAQQYFDFAWKRRGPKTIFRQREQK